MASNASRALTGNARNGRIVAAGLLGAVVLGFSLPCEAQELPDLALPDPSLPAPAPPPISSHYLQYGVALTGDGDVTR
jgi:hypothetical protein